ncbi:MAG: hypothetical protein AB8B56_11725, partial [Crocinitomicaceae bacterium]
MIIFYHKDTDQLLVDAQELCGRALLALWALRLKNYFDNLIGWIHYVAAFGGVGLLDCWIVGLLDCWIVGLVDC